MSSRVHLAVIAINAKEVKRCQDIASEFQYQTKILSTVDQMMDMEQELDQTDVVYLSATEGDKPQEVIGKVQVVKQVCAKSFLIVVIGKKMPPEQAAFIKKSGANLVLMEEEVHETSKLEYVLSQIIRASYVPIKVNEIKVDVVVDFSVYYLMPLNKKLLPVIQKGVLVEEAKMAKLKAVNELYVKRDEIDAYEKYIAKHVDLSAGGLVARCRAKYISFCASHMKLVFLLSDQSELASFDEGRKLFETCRELASDLLTSLSAIGEAWEIVNNSTIGETGSVERSPTIASYAGLISLMSDLGEPKDIMIGALVADIGMLELHPSITKKLRSGMVWTDLPADEQKSYMQHPVVSLNRCLARKLQLTDLIKNIIITTHERADRKGFPNQLMGNSIPFESQLVQFCELVDQESVVKLGQAKKNVLEVRKEIHTREMLEGRFSPSFLAQIKSGI